MVYAKDKKDFLFRCTLEGTTFSGSPMRTTLFNSLRVMSYIVYALGDNKYWNFDGKSPVKIYVSGDDVHIASHDSLNWAIPKL